MRKLITILFVCLLQNATAQMTFHWRQYSGPLQTTIVNPDSANTLVTGLNLEGIYGYEFTVTNEFGEGKDSMTVTATKGVLSITTDSVYHFIRPPEIKQLDIKVIARAGDIFIQIKSPKYQEMQCVITDIAGRRLAEMDFYIKKGTNYISAPKPQVPGMYVLIFTTYFEPPTTKLIPI